jgi:hypothetical protein
MKLLLRRDQRSGMLGGKPIFTLDVRASLTPDELANIKKYKLSETELYSNDPLADRGSGMLGLASRVAHRAITTSVWVKDLENGKHIEAKDVVELLAIEGQIREAATTFKAVLDAASHFGGEEVIEL